MEEDLVQIRRKHAQVTQDGLRHGLALSGGGIRSATFNFGLLRGLAKNAVLRRFDYLSTVSGGGYIGAMFGRLFGQGDSPKQVEEGLANDGSLLLWWLRNNGRFLTPAGSSDLLMAFSSILRGFVATQMEVAVLMLGIAFLIVVPHALASSLLDNHFSQVMGVAPSIWFWLSLVPLFIAMILSWAYWFCRDEPTRSRWMLDALTTLLVTVLGALAYSALSNRLEQVGSLNQQTLPYALAAFVLLAVPFGWLVHLALPRGKPAQQRLWLTHGLGLALGCMAVFCAFGVADLLTWQVTVYLHQQLQQGSVAVWTSTGFFGSSGVLILVLRSILPSLLERAKAGGWQPVALDKVANVLGLLLLLALQLFWLCALQTFVYLGNVMYSFDLGAAYPIWHVLLLFGALGVYVLVSGSNLQQVNLASMHFFYRSRLARTYISVGNSGGPEARFPGSPLAAANRSCCEQVESLGEMLAQDDIEIGAYRPHQAGGPIHLVNCCINQTIDDRTGNYNADRKGVALTVSALGIETGTHLPQTSRNQQFEHTTLAQWVEISGAAVGSGMGSQTASGLAALVFLTGLRLGYWIENLTLPRKSITWFAKYRATAAELLAKFPGLRQPYWYLSDGGHFDNTGIYALLKRRLDMIVAADCGADPQYLFEDVESLVRKAKIDYDAKIEFIEPASLAALLPSGDLRWKFFGTPESITPLAGEAFLLLARITYSDGKTGCLLIVKPRVSSTAQLQMSFDMIGYADRHPEFPQESTRDQFFDEAQWESYHGLGLTLSSVLQSDLLDALPQWAAQGQVAGLLAATVVPIDTPNRRQRIAQTLRTSLGVGISASVVLAAWQALDQHRNSAQAERLRYDALYQEVERSIGTEASTAKLTRQLRTLTEMAADVGYGNFLSRDMQSLGDYINELCFKSDKPLREQTCDGYQSAISARTVRGATQQYWTGLVPVASEVERVVASSPVQPTKQTAVASIAKVKSTKPVVHPVAPRPKPDVVAVPAPAPAPTPVEPVPEPTADIAEGHAPLTPQVSVEPNAGTSPSVLLGQEPELPVTPEAIPEETPDTPPQATDSADAAQTDKVSREDCARPDAQRVVLYTQVYSEVERATARTFLNGLAELKISTPGIENVSTRAARNGGAGPLAWRQPTFIYHMDAEARCALFLAQEFSNSARPIKLSESLPAEPGVIEFWLPPAARKSQ
jgi:hypothetical protein